MKIKPNEVLINDLLSDKKSKHIKKSYLLFNRIVFEPKYPRTLIHIYNNGTLLATAESENTFMLEAFFTFVLTEGRMKMDIS